MRENNEDWKTHLDSVILEIAGLGEMFKELLDFLLTGNKTDSLTLLDDSVISHRMAFLSEESRLEKGAPKKVY